MLLLPFMLGHPFYLSYTNSIYQAPVVEKFEAEGAAIHLREITTRSWAVVEYLNTRGSLHREREEIKIRNLQLAVALPSATMDEIFIIRAVRFLGSLASTISQSSKTIR